MCGVVGFLDAGLPAEEKCRQTLTAMIGSLTHRGPDDKGIWCDATSGISLGHSRLAIVDLSPAGHQPMVSASGRYVISYNGELYNTEELRHELASEGINWCGHSDTEVLLEACATWGIDSALRRANGIFAFALWDRHARTLYLSRDRLGIKPLYWARFGRLFLFGSELKALRAHPGWRAEIDRDAVATYMRLSYVPAPHSIYRGVKKLEPGCLLTITAGREPDIVRFWSISEIEKAGRAARDREDVGSTIDSLEALLKDAVRRQLVSDVPVGVFLSGGIDSSVVTALMQANSIRRIKSFSVGFRESDFDESQAARAVAKHIGTEHSELYVEPKHAIEIVPRLATIYDEPFGDSSQIPTYLISEMTRQHVAVALSGDGGDELFAGYSRYFLASGIGRWLNRIPPSARPLLARFLRAVPTELGNLAGRHLPYVNRISQPGHKLHQFAAMLMDDETAIYRRTVSHWHSPECLVRGASELKGALWDWSLLHTLPDALERMQFIDLISYLPDDILTKVDRASMAVSLETRVPILDHRVVEFAWQMPASLKQKDGRGKWALRQVLYKYVPPSLVDRPKMGFGVPIGEWLRGPLREWAEDLLDESSIAREGFLHPKLVRQMWTEHLGKRGNWQFRLWDVLMFQAWHRTWA